MMIIVISYTQGTSMEIVSSYSTYSYYHFMFTYSAEKKEILMRECKGLRIP